jgi:integrase
MSIEAAIIAGENDGKISGKTAADYLQLLISLLDYAVDKEYLSKNVASKISLGKIAKQGKRKPEEFLDNELQRLFDGYIFRPEICNYRGRLFPIHFWSIPIGLYMGTRINELCGLQVGDVNELYGIWCINIYPEGEERRVKNDNSIRQLPVPKHLIELGFIEFVHRRKQQANSTDELLFPELKSSGMKTKGDNISRWFNGEKNRPGFLESCGFKRLSGKVLYSLRHTFNDQLRNLEISEEIRNALMGHNHDTINAQYGRKMALKILKKHIDRLKFDIDITHVSFDLFRDKLQYSSPVRAINKSGRPRKRRASRIQLISATPPTQSEVTPERLLQAA